MKTCPICSTEHSRRGVTCSSGCASKKRASSSAKVRVCALCGQTFTSMAQNQKYCDNTHYKNCEVCGNSFAITPKKETLRNPTCSPHCGSVYSHRSEESRAKRKENSLKRWGVEHPFQSDEVKKKISLNPKSATTQFGTEKSQKVIRLKYGVDNVSQLEEVKQKKADTFKRNYVDKGIYPHSGPVSKVNLQWKADLERATGLTWELEKYFSNVGKIDLFCEYNGEQVAVEINPTATHNTYQNKVVCTVQKCSLPCLEHTVGKNYHHDRSRALHEEFGLSLISVFDWMDRDKIIWFIKSKLHLDSRKVYARKVELRKIPQVEANRFFKEYHLLGASRKQVHCYGLFFEDELIQVQSFAPLGGKAGAFEAKRLATKHGWVVVGGVSKVTKHFINEVKPSSITAFSDLNLSWPSYDVSFNGFTRERVNRPQKCWSKGDQMILDKSAARQSADRLLKIANDSKTSPYPEDLSNEDVFLAEGWLPVYDCGMIKDTLTIEGI